MSDEPATVELLTAAKDAAARNIDYYALLDLSPEGQDNDQPPITRDIIQRAWRKRSLKYHPDKAGANFDQAKWEEFGLARDILASDEARAAYDGARSALLQKQRERDLMNSKQRRFAEELERAEGTSRRMQEEQQARRAQEDRERERQAAEGRRYMDERRQKMKEAEDRDKERERKEDEERDDKIRKLEEQIAEKARRRAEKRAKREARKSGVGGSSGGAATADEEVDVVMTEVRPTVSAHVRELKPTEQKKTTPPIPAVVEVNMSEDPVKFWETQWPNTKARLLAAQATKERRIKEGQVTA